MYTDSEEFEVGVYLSVVYGSPWQEYSELMASVEVEACYCGILTLHSERPAELWSPEELQETAQEILSQEPRFMEWEIIQSIVQPGNTEISVSQQLLKAGHVKSIKVHHAEALYDDGSAYGVGSINFDDFKLQGEGAAEYYAQLNAKHFSADGVGSIFLQLDNCDQLLRLAMLQGGLQDNKQQLAALGASSTHMTADKKYVLVHTPGLDGSWQAGDLPADTIIRTVVTKGGVVDLVANLPRRSTDVATLILTADNRLITTFPGLPSAPMEHGLPEGIEVRAGDLEPGATSLAAS